MASINSPYRIWHHPCPKKFCIEYIVTSLLLKEDARGFDAVAVILAKNSFNCNLLAFLSQKYELTPRPLGILNVLRQNLQCLVTKTALWLSKRTKRGQSYCASGDGLNLLFLSFLHSNRRFVCSIHGLAISWHGTF